MSSYIFQDTELKSDTNIHDEMKNSLNPGNSFRSSMKSHFRSLTLSGNLKLWLLLNISAQTKASNKKIDTVIT
jgi:hypothetical protein